MAVEEGDFLAVPFPTGGELYRIKKKPFTQTYAPHFRSDHIPSQAETLTHWQGKLRDHRNVFRKSTKINAKLALEDGVLDASVHGSEPRKQYRKGEFIIVQEPEGGRCVMSPVDFSEAYNLAISEPASSARLADEGFQLYEHKPGKIWAYALSADDIKKYFPVGQFFSRSGSTMTVNEGDYLAIPFPSGREVYPIKQAVLATAYAHDAYVPTQLATLSEWETVLKLESVYCKTAKMHAKLAAEDGVLETVVGGVVETSKAYEKGDFILSGTEGERYVNAARLA